MAADHSNQNQHGSGANDAVEALGQVLGVSFQNRSEESNRVDEGGYRIQTVEPINPIPLNVSTSNEDDVSNISNQSSGVVENGAQGLPMGSAVLAGAASILGGGPYRDTPGKGEAPGKGKGRSSSPNVVPTQPLINEGKSMERGRHPLPPPPPMPPSNDSETNPWS